MRSLIRRLLLIACLPLAAAAAAPRVVAAAPAPKRVAGLAPEQALVLGQRMYREGFLPSGEEMQATVKGDVSVPGSAFTCSSCHLRSGLGSIEGGVFTLPTNGAKLAQPLFGKFPKIPPSERENYGLKSLPRRPAYTDETLAIAIRYCADPTGREFNAVMPRYDLSDRDMEILIHYLKNLSSQLSPGASDKVIHFATVITDEVRAEDREAMLLPLQNYITQHNRIALNFDTKMYVFGNGPEMMLGYRQLSLDTWVLKGAPSTWRRQLEAYQKQKPAFALLGGISYQDWKPIHDFCETRQIPCLFPITDYPVISETDWYTLYLSKGLQQESQAAARYLKNVLPEGQVLQVVQDSPQGRALAAGFQAAWAEVGGAPVQSVPLPPKAGPDYLRDLVRKVQPQAVLLWTGPGIYPALERAVPDLPARVFMASGFLGKQLLALPEKARGITYLTYPYRHPEEEAKYSSLVNHLLVGYKSYHPETRISTRMYSLTQILTTALMDMEQNLYRDTLLDVIGMQRDQVVPDYERLSFGPGQRYAAKGCYLMQLSEGPNPTLLKKSGWVTY